MIDSISSSTMMPAMAQSSGSSNSLTSSQKDTITSVLENYDASNLSQSDAQSIVATFEEAGIEPSSELVSAMEEAGFDAQEVGSLAGVQGGQGGMPPPPPSEEEVSSISTLLDSLLSSEEDDDSSISTDDIMDYTSRILSLNEESKEEVMNLLETYSNENSEYSQEEVDALIKSSLSDILSDNENYNSVSFYG